jgi:hypothetical protein
LHPGLVPLLERLPQPRGFKKPSTAKTPIIADFDAERATTPKTESFLLPRAGRLFFKKEALTSPSTPHTSAG